MKIASNTKAKGGRPHRKLPEGCTRRSDNEGYRSLYEKKLAQANPFLEYEPDSFKYEYLKVEKAALAECRPMAGGFFVPKELCVFRKVTYTPDFKIPAELSHTGKPIYIEAKGGRTVLIEDLYKLRAIKAVYPDLDLRFLLETAQARPGKQSASGAREAYKSFGFVTDWLDEAQTSYAIGFEVPKTWLSADLQNVA